ncbi:MAG: hypothetical protein EOO50_07385 [Flavobacterium sp.]|uniref:hypothetical protein n=1 Tax=Flavobacterium sp. TaxID=239 RepID=UPI00120CE02C|nr:hypothetical protein [Flavobacterium sp.]RZJ67077.1 MAG: hypothetical protein EOO50_07385 [Flavobacterium sp.]
MKIFDSRLHGSVDYAVVAFLFISPYFFGSPEKTALFTYVLGGIHLALTLFTNFELGFWKVIPFRVHGLIELVVAFALFGVAYYLGGIEGDLPKYFYSAFGLAVLLVWLLTDYKSTKSSGY